MRDEASEWIWLHVGELFLIWTELGLGELPAHLRVEHVGRTPRSRAEFIAGASEALSQRGLGTVADPSAELSELLRTVDAADLVCEFETTTSDTHLRAIAARTARRGAAIARVGTDVRVGPVRPSNLSGVLFDAVEPLPAAPSAPGNVSVDVFEAACKAGAAHGKHAFKDVLYDARVRGPEVAVIVRAINERVAGGRFSARIHDGHGWRRTSCPLAWADTPDGRYAIRRHDDWVTITPADVDRLTGMAEEVLRQLVG